MSGGAASNIWFNRDASRGPLIQWLRANARGRFLRSVLDAFENYGTLTAGQEAAVRKIMGQSAPTTTET